VLDPTTGGHGVYFEEQKELNRELAAIGNTLMALECRRVIHDKSVREGTNVRTATMEESELLAGELPHRISVSELQDAYGNDYLMVLNRDYRVARRYVLSLKEEQRVWLVDTADGRERIAFDDTTRSIVGTLAPGSLALYRLQPKTAAAVPVEYYLDKGTLV
jgi:hypothetical protein